MMLARLSLWCVWLICKLLLLLLLLSHGRLECDLTKTLLRLHELTRSTCLRDVSSAHL